MVSSPSSNSEYINASPSEASRACQEESPPPVYLWRVMFHGLIPHDLLQELCSSTHLDLFALTVYFQTRSRELERRGKAQAMRTYRDDDLLGTAHARDNRPPAIHPKIYSPPHASTSQLHPPCTRHASGTYPSDTPVLPWSAAQGRSKTVYLLQGKLGLPFCREPLVENLGKGFNQALGAMVSAGWRRLK